TRARIADIYRELPPWLSSTPRRKALDLYAKAYEEFGKFNDRASQAAMKVAMGLTIGDEATRSANTEGDTQFNQALEHIESGLEIYKELGDERKVALALSHAGDVARKGQSPEMRIKAYDYLTRSLEAYRQVHDQQKMAYLARTLVAIDEQMQRYDRALTGYWLVLELYRSLKQPINEAIAVAELGRAFVDTYTNPNTPALQKQALTKDAPRLIELMRNSAATQPYTSNATWRGILLTNLGRIHEERKEYEEAVKVFEEALKDLKRAKGYEPSQFYVLGFLTRISRITGKQQEQKRYLQEAAQLIPQMPVLSLQHENSLQLGSTALAANEHKLAAEAFKVAIDISKKIQQPIYMPASLPSTLHRVAKEYSLNERWEEAMGYFTQATQLYQKHNEFFGEALVATSIAEGYARRKDHVKAIEYHEQALKLYRRAGNNFAAGNALRSISSSYRILGDKAKAEQYQKQAEALGQGIVPLPPAPPLQ
ncbi:MAG TPA: tetratricopeptide repeat protein, partial [Pyrinomonadaceae bacterium]